MVERFSKIGFIMAMAGSTVGLGNVWKFPTMVGNNGGSAFILLYLIFNLTIIGVAFMAELVIGRLGRSDTADSMKKLAPSHKKAWSQAGWTMIAPIFIASFYILIVGWIFYYVCLSFATDLPATEAIAQETFKTLAEDNLISATLCFTMVFVMVFYSVARGIKSGIEKLNLWMMPMLFVLLFFLIIYALFSSGNFLNAVKFLFIPDFSKIADSKIILDALGLSLFSLSMGVGTVLTYGASLSDDTDIQKSTYLIVIINLVISLMMGLVVFSFITISEGQPAASGPGLVFVSLASLFAQMGIIGSILAAMFFVSLLFAGITSAVSMIEPLTLYFINKFGFSRIKSVIIIGVITFVLGFACLLSYYGATSKYFSLPAGILGNEKAMPFFDMLDYLTSNIMMPIGALVFSIFVGWFLDKKLVYSVLSSSMSERGYQIWRFVLRYLVPITILVIGFYQFVK